MTTSLPNLNAFLESWGQELAARQNRVRSLIGNAHWLSDGHHKEAILRDFLSRYLPNEVECTTGFVRSAVEERRCSPEIDILLFSPRLHPPYFAEGGISIVDPSALLANLEIKSTFSSGPLNDALENIKITRSLVVGDKGSPSDLWSGLFFYDLPESRTLESTLDTLLDSMRSILPIDKHKHHYPTCIVLGQNCLAFPTINEKGMKIRAFEGAGSAFSSAICDLLANVTGQIGGMRLSGLQEWSEGTEMRVVERVL